MPTNSKQHFSSVKTTTVYSGPGYPLDPAKEERRMLERGLEYSCEMVPPKRKLLRSEEVTLTFGSKEEADAWMRMVASRYAL